MSPRHYFLVFLVMSLMYPHSIHGLAIKSTAKKLGMTVGKAARFGFALPLLKIKKAIILAPLALPLAVGKFLKESRVKLFAHSRIMQEQKSQLSEPSPSRQHWEQRSVHQSEPLLEPKSVPLREQSSERNSWRSNFSSP